MRHMGLKAEERHVQELHRFERVRLFGTECGGNVLDERIPRGSHKPATDPYAGRFQLLLLGEPNPFLVHMSCLHLV